MLLFWMSNVLQKSKNIYFYGILGENDSNEMRERDIMKNLVFTQGMNIEYVMTSDLTSTITVNSVSIGQEQ